MLLSGPSGCFQHAPGTYFHHALAFVSGTGPGGGVNTIDPAMSSSSRGFNAPGGRYFFTSSHTGFFSAVVTYPVASTNFRNAELVTSVSSIQKPSTRTLCAGCSVCGSLRSLEPIMNSPP